MDIRFDGKRALVTGAGKGIGRGVARRLAECGAEVVALSRTQADLDSLKAEFPSILTYQVDLSDWDATRKICENVGPIDLLVNNAGNTDWTPFLQVSKDLMERLFDVNFKAAFNVSQVLAKGMVERKTGGAIVNVSSVASLMAVDNHTVYCSTKGALDSLTQALALELGRHQIRVNGVQPHPVLTELGKIGWSDPVKRNKFLERVPIGRLAEVDDVVDTVVYLLSDKAAMINGIAMPIDGGFMAV